MKSLSFAALFVESKLSQEFEFELRPRFGQAGHISLRYVDFMRKYCPRKVILLPLRPHGRQNTFAGGATISVPIRLIRSDNLSASQ